MRLIDADAFKQYITDGLEEMRKLFKDNGEFAEMVTKEFCRDIDEQPTIKTNQWTPITTRPMDEEERLEWSEKLGYDIEYEEAVIYEHLPDDGQDVLTCSRYNRIAIDKFEDDPDYGCCFEENGEMDGIVAWMPLPEPYKEENKHD